MPKLGREQIRLLKLLSHRAAELEWPCRNEWIPTLIRDGFAVRTRDYKCVWNGREHDVTTIKITRAGLEALDDALGQSASRNLED